MFGTILIEDIKRQLTQLDHPLMGEDHPKILATDEIYFWREYTSGKDYTFSSTNNLISNLKKPPTRPPAQLRHKRRVIAECADLLSKTISEGWKIDETKAPADVQFIAIVDDVLTAGVHYRAAADMLRERYPNAVIVGLFIARRVFPEPDFPRIPD